MQHSVALHLVSIFLFFQSINETNTVQKMALTRLPLSFIFMDFTLQEGAQFTILVKNENRQQWRLGPNVEGRQFMYIPQISNFPQVAFAMRVTNTRNVNLDLYVYVGINGVDPVPGSNNSSVAFSVALFTIRNGPNATSIDILADGASIRAVGNSYPAAFGGTAPN